MSYSFTAVINSENGLHARSAALLLNTVKKYNVNGFIKYKENNVNIKHLVDIIALSIKHGSEIEIIIEGDNENICAMEIKKIIENNFEV